MSAAEAGAVESDGTSLYWTNATPTRQTIFSYSPTATATFAVTVSAGDVVKFQNLAVDGYSTIRLYDSTGAGKAAFGYGNASAASFTSQVYINASAVPLLFSISGSEKMRIEATAGRVGIGVTAPTAILHLKAGTAAANTEPLKIPSGVVLSVTEPGAVEADNNHLYWTNSSGVRQPLNYQTLTTTDVNVAGPYTILPTDYLLHVRRTATAPISLNLPSIAVVGDGFVVGAKDSGYNASTNNITWVRNGTDTIENVAGNYAQNVTGSTIWLVANATTNNWEIV